MHDRPYTLSSDARAEAEVAERVAALVASLGKLQPEASVVLLGSLAAGDAAVARTPKGLRWLSDAEVALLHPWLPPRALAEARRAASAAMPGVEVGVWWTHPLRLRLARATGVTRNLYDLRHASRVLAGPDRVAALPLWRPTQIPPWEGYRLLFNRMAEHMAAPRRDVLAATYADAKLVQGCMEAWLLALRQHAPRLPERLRTFEGLHGHEALRPWDPPGFAKAVAFRADPKPGTAPRWAERTAGSTLAALAEAPTSAEALRAMARPRFWRQVQGLPPLGRLVERLRHPHAALARKRVRGVARHLRPDLAAYWLVALAFVAREDAEAAAMLEEANHQLHARDPEAAILDAWGRLCY